MHLHMYMPSSLCFITAQKWIRDVHVSALCWRTGTCFGPFVAVLIILFLLKTFSSLDYTLSYVTLNANMRYKMRHM